MTTSTPTSPQAATEPDRAIRGTRAPLLLVGGAIAFNLIGIRAERNFVPLLNDGSIHAQMVRAATAAFRAGHLPLTTWYPYLGLGSPQFLHYQSLGAMLTGIAGLVVGPNRAFSWSLYLLVSFWPVSVYVAGRLFGFSRAQSGVAAACSPFLFSAAQTLAIGYEPSAYLWIGYGLWSQLFAMWTLPIAWGAGWRYIGTGRFGILAIVVGAATIGFHFMTGYLALLPIIAWVVLSPGAFVQRLRRGVVLGVATVLCAAWVIYPVIDYGKWTSVNEFLQHTGLADSYGARQVLTWLVSGDLFDAGRFPSITILAGIGLLVCAATIRKVPHHRAIIGVFALSLLLFFGRPTLGPLIDLLPGNRDLFLRRFLLGVQLSSLYLAGVGAVAVRDHVIGFTRGRWTVVREGRLPRGIGTVTAGLVLVAVLAPAWIETSTYDHNDAVDIALQQQADITSGSAMNLVVAQMEALGPGRVYAGMPSPSWGASFTVGQVPVFKYLSNLDFDMVGYTLRTASLMTDPEEYFDENNVGDYTVFGIRYLVLPTSRPPVPKATLVLTSGEYRLWEIPGAGYVQVASTRGTIAADRTNIGARTEGFLDSALPNEQIYETVAFDGQPAAPSTLGNDAAVPTDIGSVTTEQDDLGGGTVHAVVDATATAVVVLKASFDPGWTVTVDGRRATPYMVSPALVAVTVSPGVHRITFEYRGYQGYPELFALGAITLVILIVDPYRRRRRVRDAAVEPPSS